ncbi:MAG: ROK family protein [Candidatus Kapaibacteriota bacterium]
MNTERFYLGVDVGGTNLKFGLINSTYELIYENTLKLPVNTDGLFILEFIKQKIDEILNKFSEIQSIGIGVPGVINEKGEIVISPNIPQFNGLKIIEYFTQKFKLPVAIDNDANVAAIAEMEAGVAKSLTNFVYITLGTGVGGSIIINRNIYRGSSGAAGEIGHIILNPFDEIDANRPYRTGVLEEYLGKEAIIKIAVNLSRKFANSPIVVNNKYDVASISHFADKGDHLSIETMKLAGYYLGIAIVSAANLLDIPNFVIGGGISKSSKIFYNSALEVAKKRALPHLSEKIKICNAQFTSKSGIIGAAIFGKFSQNNNK